MKVWLSKCFSKKDLGELAYILRIKICYDKYHKLFCLSQNAYFYMVLKRFSMEESKKLFLLVSYGVELLKKMSLNTRKK